MKILHKTAILHQRNERKLHKTARFEHCKLHKMANTLRILIQNKGQYLEYSMKFRSKDKHYFLIIKGKGDIFDSGSRKFHNIYPLAA